MNESLILIKITQCDCLLRFIPQNRTAHFNETLHVCSLGMAAQRLWNQWQVWL